ncbi:LOW QUALITY PROTEIN: hypothetical protein TorRG33x02_054340 [Trema orientale]|uniref:Uncharacterized protein n=1 Tax=Trema orientale TaxID=63057 RepID=A0A2P5FM20_TREOI|nr:LOW QUALITY PROTEIN: hypothetical protein TorRG33x02_054340 [Trema orientale]
MEEIKGRNYPYRLWRRLCSVRGFSGRNGSNICKSIVNVFCCVHVSSVFELVRVNRDKTNFRFLVTKTATVPSQSLGQVHDSWCSTFKWQLG